MFLKKDLGWLNGYPISQSDGKVVWQHRCRVQAAEVKLTTIDADCLRRSQFTVIHLAGQFPRAMPKIVGNVERWKERCLRLLGVLKDAVHRHRQLTNRTLVRTQLISEGCRRRELAILKDSPRLMEITQPVCWSTLTEPEVGQRLLDWIHENDSWCLQRLSLKRESTAILILVMADLCSVDVSSAFAAWGSILADTQSFRTATRDYAEVVYNFADYFGRWKNRERRPDVPVWPVVQTDPTTEQSSSEILKLGWKHVQSLGVATEQAVSTAAGMKSRERHQFIRMWQLLMPNSVPTAWLQIWQDLDRLLADARQQVTLANHSQKRHRAATRQIAATLRDIAVQFRDQPLTPVRGDEARQTIEQLLQHGGADLCEQVSKMLDAVQAADSYPLRNVLAAELARKCKTMPPKLLRTYVRQMTELLRAADTPNRYLWIWAQAVENWLHGTQTCFETPLDVLEWRLSDDPAGRRTYFQALRVLVRSEFQQPIDHDHLAIIACATNDPDRAASLAAQLQRDENVYFSAACLKTAVRLADAPDAFRDLVNELRCEVVSDDDLDGLVLLNDCLTKAGWPHFTTRLIRAGRLERLLDIVRRTRASGKQFGELNVPTRCSLVEPADWISDLPAELSDAASILAGSFADGEDRAVKIIHRKLRPAACIQQEIDYLQKIAADLASSPTDYRARRLKKLKTYLSSSCRLDQAQVGRLQHKLQMATDDLLLHHLQNLPLNAIRIRIQRLLGVSCDLTNLNRHKVGATLLVGLFGLEEPFRSLGLRVFNSRMGGPEFNPDLLPANQRFLSRLRRQGVDPAPWLEHGPRKTVEVADDVIDITIVRGGIDVLSMGYHFNTCLSPTEFNFFSAVTNAVDVNKVVVYARDQKDTVIGRCLLAIGDQGGIVSFRPYCHMPDFRFEEHVKQICNELAVLMKTVVATGDHVSPLALPKWYDDDSVDLGNSIDGPSSPIEQVLLNSTEETLIHDLSLSLSPLKFSAATLPFILSSVELRKRPKLFRVLLPFVDESMLADDRCILRLARLMHDCGETDRARRLLKRHSNALFERAYRTYGGQFLVDFKDELQLLATRFPSQLLRAIRRTRPADVADDLSERHATRRALLAVVHQQLGRDRKARHLSG